LLVSDTTTNGLLLLLYKSTYIFQIYRSKLTSVFRIPLQLALWCFSLPRQYFVLSYLLLVEYKTSEIKKATPTIVGCLLVGSGSATKCNYIVFNLAVVVQYVIILLHYHCRLTMVCVCVAFSISEVVYSLCTFIEYFTD
jgi:hypothetical protein